MSKDIEQIVGIDRNVMEYKSYRDAGVLKKKKEKNEVIAQC